MKHGDVLYTIWDRNCAKLLFPCSSFELKGSCVALAAVVACAKQLVRYFQLFWWMFDEKASSTGSVIFFWAGCSVFEVHRLLEISTRCLNRYIEAQSGMKWVYFQRLHNSFETGKPFSHIKEMMKSDPFLLILKYVRDKLIDVSTKIFTAMKLFQQTRYLKNRVY